MRADEQANGGPQPESEGSAEFTRFLLRRGAIVLLLMALAMALAWIIMSSKQAVFETRFALLLQPSTSLKPSTFDDAQSALQREEVPISRTIAAILGSEPVLRRSLRSAGLDPKESDVEHRVFIRPGTTILELSVDGSDPDSLLRIVPALEQESRRELEDAFHGVYVFRPVQNATRTAQIAPQVRQRVELVAVLALTVFGGLALLDIRIELRRQRRRRGSARVSAASAAQGGLPQSTPDPPTA